MSWQDIMRRVLSPTGGVEPHITSRYGEVEGRPPGSTKPHRGVDFSYDVPGQKGINLANPALRSPVTGIVTQAGEGKYGTIAIRDPNGFSHELLHSHSRYVAVGDPVVAGQLIGTMGNTGVTNDPRKGNHVHYQLKDSAGTIIDPNAFWNEQGPADPNPASPAYLGEYQQYLRGLGANADNAALSDEAANPDGSKVVRRLVRVSGPTAAALVDMATKPVAPLNEIPPDRPASFDDRFGDWTSSPQASAPRGPYQPGSPQQGSRPLGIVTGKPMPDYPFPPPIWGPPNNSGSQGDDIEDWYARWLGPARWK